MKFELYQDSQGEFRWRLRAVNGNIIADSAEGYANKQDCIDVLWSIAGGAEKAKIEDWHNRLEEPKIIRNLS